VDIKAPTTLIDAVHGALVHACAVQNVHTRLSDHVGHALEFTPYFFVKTNNQETESDD
jgi:hypothetical protein